MLEAAPLQLVNELSRHVKGLDAKHACRIICMIESNVRFCSADNDETLRVIFYNHVFVWYLAPLGVPQGANGSRMRSIRRRVTSNEI